MTLAAAALSALRGATSVCAATVGRFSPEECAEGVALANDLINLFTMSTVAAASVRDRHVGAGRALSLPHFPTELLLQIVRHLGVRDLGRLACTCRQLYFGPPCPPRPTSVVEEELRRRAAEAGRWLPPSPPAGASGWVPALLQREWRESLVLGTVAAGASPHSLFLDANGALLVCGFEQWTGVLGLPSNQDGEAQFRTMMVPILVPSMAGIRIQQVVAGSHCSLAVSEAGRVYMWGQAQYGRLASDERNRLVPTLIHELSHHRVRQVAMSSPIFAAVTEEGLLFTWATVAPVHEAQQGWAALGLGLAGAAIGNPWPPQCVTALKDERVASVAIEMTFTLVTTEAGAVYSFGVGMTGSLGHGNRENQVLPKRIEALDGYHVATVAAGDYQSLALTACGRVFWWGGRLKSPTEFVCQALPQLVDSTFGGGRVRSIAANFATAYAVTDAGVLFSWGCDGYAHDGYFPITHGSCQVQQSPRPVAGLHGITVVACRLVRDTHWRWPPTAASMRSALAGPWASAGVLAEGGTLPISKATQPMRRRVK
jgi:hypothetical protein